MISSAATEAGGPPNSGFGRPLPRPHMAHVDLEPLPQNAQKLFLEKGLNGLLIR